MTITTQAEDTRDALLNGVTTCETCIFSDPGPVADGDWDKERDFSCHRRPPSSDGWPVVSADAWCGEWDSGEYPLEVRPEAECPHDHASDWA